MTKLNPNKVLIELGYSKKDPKFADKWAEMCLHTAQLIELLPEDDFPGGVANALEYNYGKPDEEPKEAMRSQSDKAPVAIIGAEQIPANIYPQVEQIAQLPGVTRMALMPDAHPGMGWAIGSVTETEDRVFPNAVGVDIGCRMMLTLVHLPVSVAFEYRTQLAHVMTNISRFGMVGWDDDDDEHPDHHVMEDHRWKQHPVAKRFHDLAARQLGTSGGGNHFFDLMIGKTLRYAPWMEGSGLRVGDEFVAIMTHSGSRGTGAKIANHYQKVAQDYTNSKANGIPRDLAWLDMSTDQGKEYWDAMDLMGRYAQANHEVIHNRFLEAAGLDLRMQLQNHHNFAWHEDGKIVHRKGATPAYRDMPGIIPGTSGGRSIVVNGLGNKEFINSSSHGAGRPFSRTEAKKRWSQIDANEMLNKVDVLHIGVTPDESPMAYKNPDDVFAAQEGVLFDTVLEMRPIVVIMGGKSDDGD